MVYPLDKWESDLGIVELLDVWASALAGGNWFNLDDLQLG